MPDIRLDSTTNTREEVAAALGVTPVTPETVPVVAPVAASETVVAPKATPETPAVEKPVAASETKPAETDDDDSDDEPDPQDSSEAGRALSTRRRKMQHRIDKLTFEKHTSVAERDRALAKATELQAKLDALTSGKPATDPVSDPVKTADPVKPATFDTPRPKQGDFDDYEKYEEARDAWVEAKTAFNMNAALAERDRKAAEAVLAAEEVQRRATLAREIADEDAAYQRRLVAAKAKHPDFQDVFEQAKDLAVSRPMLDHMRFSEMGAELTYYFATHPTEAERVAQMAPAPAIAEMGRLEARIEAGLIGGASDAPPTAGMATVSAPARVPVSKAPAPMTRPGGGSTTSSKPLDEEDYQTFKQRRQAAIAGSRR